MSDQIHVVGARPNFIKAAPVVSALREVGEKPVLVHTGQHYEPELSHVFFEQLGLPEPDRNLGVGSGSHGTQTAALLTSLESLALELRPERIVVYGDINSTLAASLVAAKLHIPVAHVEAGLRSFDRSMPEEINRVVTDALADMHFTTSPEAEDHLRAEGVDGKGIHFVGNPMIDTLVRFRAELDAKPSRARFDLDGAYAVCTLHRPANVDDLDIAADLVGALGEVAKELPVLLPLHPRGRATLTGVGLMDTPGVIVTDPLGYLEFMALMSEAALVLTDSGGIQEETTVLGVPCLTLRENTERPITVTMGTNRLVGRDPERIVTAAHEALHSPPGGKTPPLWDGNAGKRIAEILQR
ncbi:MAG TPA: UDP-N-acetylglucosamine 2-epimerase (non-hydrolyzing) [Acidimicrobiia bacterium]|nr:UDP-N-acetylglucosamine 2-epimerase (non-hydrolyzing) [Acidimicrobiia bacterium]